MTDLFFGTSGLGLQVMVTQITPKRLTGREKVKIYVRCKCLSHLVAVLSKMS